MLISSKNNTTKSTATLKIDDENLDQVTHTKFLGLLLDQHLCWDQHIQYCAKKISSGLYALNSAKNILNSCHLRMLCHTMVNPYLLYGNILWGGAYQKYTKRLNIMQKKGYSYYHERNLQWTYLTIIQSDKHIKINRLTRLSGHTIHG